ncbi:MAG: ABC transporter permease [Candidatus Adiutrix sp.]|jgi:putative ABC transport system permease protein|nr:ABC transporter permease [Candidatus Adiutrix sp.]
MRRMVYLCLATLKRKRFRSGVMFASLVLACALLFAATVLSRGIHHTLKTTQERLGADLVAVPAEARDEAEAALVSGSPTVFYMPAALEERVAATPGVKGTCAQLFLRSLSAPCCDSEVSLVGFDPGRDFTIDPWALQKLGGPLESDQIIVGAKVISAVVGTPAKAIGQRLIFMGKPLTVGTILEPTGLGADYTVFLTLETAHQMIQGSPLYPLPIEKDQVSAILIRLEDGADQDAVARAVEQRVPEVKVITADQLVSSYGRKLGGLLNVLLAAGGLFCGLAAVLAGSLFVLSVRQRMREIGLFLALGARRDFIFRLVALEAVGLCGAGGLVGVLIGLAAIRFGRGRLEAMIGNFYMWPDQAFFLKAAGLTLLAALVTGGLGGLYPAWRISRVEPYDAIRRGE